MLTLGESSPNPTFSSTPTIFQNKWSLFHAHICYTIALLFLEQSTNRYCCLRNSYHPLQATTAKGLGLLQRFATGTSHGSTNPPIGCKLVGIKFDDLFLLIEWLDRSFSSRWRYLAREGFLAKFPVVVCRPQFQNSTVKLDQFL